MVSVAIEPYASSAEILPINADMPNRIMVSARREGELAGYLCITFDRGIAFGHDTRCWDEDKWTAARLWLFARKMLRQMGVRSVVVHINGADTVGASFWESKGFRKMTEIWTGDI